MQSGLWDVTKKCPGMTGLVLGSPPLRQVGFSTAPMGYFCSFIKLLEQGWMEYLGKIPLITYCSLRSEPLHQHPVWAELLV